MFVMIQNCMSPGASLYSCFTVALNIKRPYLYKLIYHNTVSNNITEQKALNSNRSC